MKSFKVGPTKGNTDLWDYVLADTEEEAIEEYKNQNWNLTAEEKNSIEILKTK